MDILFDHPKASDRWKLTKETRPDGKSVILSGYGGTGDFYGSYKRKIGTVEGYAWTEVPNVVFYARIKAEKQSRGRTSAILHFSDVDGLHQYQTGIAGALAIFQALQDRILEISPDGFIEGFFTFKKMGKEIYIFPIINSNLLDLCHKNFR